MSDYWFSDEDDFPRQKKTSKKPLSFVVCEACENLLFKYYSTCPYCKNYRFSDDYDRIKDARKVFYAKTKEYYDYFNQ